ncbi:MAG TPA: bifunctional phosphoribosyl-AMP cyclohydrolase/phosphoribosyl-ATP diphosphatase HisIE [Bacteroidales bacterium]|nr:bifunctional phosphoribosyl-AMP cyclohydrolase/phosphoribosyl-ATP diphosphatase HisIE [Bacteroidales bacterium]HRR93783.1 bifunctional phosphoribosyl-AMP cyclohydrolase/phosphoribosyl-ATP diphosphatase HisIE [Bacteroidales bacterium]HRT89630.1 bifunctional phosphoribosyl-AMP cyclohydrolase/phosphoribosyl-ATP diphosphatase HisIE [Bacteroidales bacterium]
MNKIDFSKGSGLVPAIIQDSTTLQVLMVGFMNEETFNRTINEGKVTFFSRSRKKQWTKGETSGNFLYAEEILTDCDDDAILIKVKPAGPVCHKGTTSCFGDAQPKGFIYRLEEIINKRIYENTENSYTNKLYREGIGRVAQKTGEEAVELVIEALKDDSEAFKNEAADLIYHLLLLLRTKGCKLEEIEEILMNRHKNK